MDAILISIYFKQSYYFIVNSFIHLNLFNFRFNQKYFLFFQPHTILPALCKNQYFLKVIQHIFHVFLSNSKYFCQTTNQKYKCNEPSLEFHGEDQG